MTTRQGVDADYAAELLHRATPPDEVKRRQGPGGRMLDYIDARYVMDVLDQLGPENWRDEYVDRPDGSVRCGLSILVDGEWVTKWDVGTASDIEPEKGAYSEAFKRAAVKWGVARDLYGHAPNHNAAATPPAAAGGSAGGRAAMPRPSAPTTPEEPEDMREALHAPARPSQAPSGAPTCPVHHWAMKPKKSGHGFFCTGKLPDGSWCVEEAA